MKEKYLFGFKEYSAGYLQSQLHHTKAGRFGPAGELYFTMVVKGLRGSEESKIIWLDEELKKNGWGNIDILAPGDYIKFLLNHFGQ